MSRLSALFVALIMIWTIPAQAGRPTLFLIDMQNGFLDDVREPRQRLVDQQLQLLEWAKAHELNVIVIEYAWMGRTDPLLRDKLDEFPVERVVTVAKSEDGAFEDRKTRGKILTQLDRWQSDRVVVCGINASACVFSTIAGALDYGYRVYTAEQVLGDFSRPAIHRTPAPLPIVDLPEGLRVWRERSRLEACADLLEDAPMAMRRMGGGTPKVDNATGAHMTDFKLMSFMRGILRKGGKK